jgi:asparaginyl-tRNA synthetase
MQIRQILQEAQPDSTLEIAGWVTTRRVQKTFSFIELNDGSCLKGLQVIVDNTVPNYDKTISMINTGASIKISGRIKESKGKGQRIELHAELVKVIGTVADDYPLQKNRMSPEFLRENSHLRARTKVMGMSTRVRSACAQAIHRFFEANGFFYAHTPILTASDCEGAGEMFQVTTIDPKNPPLDDKGNIDYSKDFFGRKTFLTVSGQLSAENLACGLSRVYTFGPTFRAENSNTSRHANEFWMIEPEMAFADLNANADLAENFLQSVITDVLNKCQEDLEFCEQIITHKKFTSPFFDDTKVSLLQTLEQVASTPFIRITYTEAIALLQKSGVSFQHSTQWGEALQTEHERYLSEVHFKAPVIVTDYPASFKSFYMYLNDDEKTVRAMDVLVPRIGEIIGGSQREDRLDVLKERIIHHGLDPADYWWYTDLRKFGTVPHAGFGLGFERLVMYLTGLRNIRDVISFPRTPKYAEF